MAFMTMRNLRGTIRFHDKFEHQERTYFLPMLVHDSPLEEELLPVIEGADFFMGVKVEGEAPPELVSTDVKAFPLPTPRARILEEIVIHQCAFPSPSISTSSAPSK